MGEERGRMGGWVGRHLPCSSDDGEADAHTDAQTCPGVRRDGFEEAADLQRGVGSRQSKGSDLGEIKQGRMSGSKVGVH